MRNKAAPAASCCFSMRTKIPGGRCSCGSFRSSPRSSPERVSGSYPCSRIRRAPERNRAGYRARRSGGISPILRRQVLTWPVRRKWCSTCGKSFPAWVRTMTACFRKRYPLTRRTGRLGTGPGKRKILSGRNPERCPLDHIARLAGIRKYPPEGGDERRGQGIHEGYESAPGVRPCRPQNEADQKGGFDEVGEVEHSPPRPEHPRPPAADHHSFLHHFLLVIRDDLGHVFI